MEIAKLQTKITFIFLRGTLILSIYNIEKNEPKIIPRKKLYDNKLYSFTGLTVMLTSIANCPNKRNTNELIIRLNRKKFCFVMLICLVRKFGVSGAFLPLKKSI